ncbi:UNVERIFIED_CONTAM: hypothetical protein K2H54_069441 [Gekko kuhli]
MNVGTVPKTTLAHIFLMPRGPRQQLYQLGQLRWGQFNLDSKEETYVLMKGPQRDNQFNIGMYPESSSLLHGMTSEAATRAWVTDRMRECSGHRSLEDEEYGLGQWLTAVEQIQQRMMQEFEEVILAIPDMVIRVLRAEREVQQPAPGLLPLQVPQQVLQQSQLLSCKTNQLNFKEINGGMRIYSC